MIRVSKLIAENENCKLEIFLKLDDKNKIGQNAGLLGRITNRYTEQLFEFFNANEIKVPDYARVFEASPGPPKKSKRGKK